MGKWVKPFPDSKLTGHFGKIRTFKGAPTNPHRGTDYAPGADVVIPNVTAGEVALIKWSNVMGWGLIIETDAKDTDGKPWFVGYHHLSCAKHGINCKGPQVHGEHSPFSSTKVGDRKDLKEPVGRVGNSGTASSGPHCHMTLSKTVTGAWSGKVYDLYAQIVQSVAEKPEIQSPSKPETQVIFACPHCKKELKA